MNIKEAKEEIKRTLHAYTQRTPEGILQISAVQQRPVLLIGPPGIGKTAIMKQIAREESVGLVAYTMTHHTRQSAIGLPVLKERTYNGRTYSITEYTMSEIVASVYDCMEATGYTSGILFIDEMNCVSETLTPVMLQLLQNKTFGNHQIPEGWLIVAAGNPPAYNRSVREFDMVTLDRVKNMCIEADYSVWKEYACANAVHPSISAYLNIYPDCFYSVQNQDNHLSFVTARGWEDLSCIIKSYESCGDPVTETLIRQYLQHDEIARNFYLFYDLFTQYASDFANDDFFGPNVIARINTAEPAESISVASMLFAKASAMIREYSFSEQVLKHMSDLKILFKRMKDNCALEGENTLLQLEQFISKRRTSNRIREDNGLLPLQEKILELHTLRLLEEQLLAARKRHLCEDSAFMEMLDNSLKDMKKHQNSYAEEILAFLSDSYRVLEAAPDDVSLLYFTSDLTNNPECSEFLSSHPCRSYLSHTGPLLLQQREDEIRAAMKTAAKD
ncbi:AAA family ATPase [Ruminococcus sp. OA3]|uniref:AAA family ATPase n=1 Tax=Ruminococcus sp. OA3 TaxID=2914164 RepID=UPI001F0524CE|nr:AAA family ATPase [Ruminococcus sp. OA3]MCH1980988.1 AAA family ATPase [Ruminococcus sp. OA3]